ncbi:MAG: HNH endonuclease [Oligoflexia bacterium]|nr:HNH endonuclease [Oligoflexia bacterium]
MNQLFYAPVDPIHIKKEKAKARELRETQWWKQKLAQGICNYCEQKFTKVELTMDHVLPIGRGGFSTKGNIVVCCKECNTKKAHKLPVEIFLETLS